MRTRLLRSWVAAAIPLALATFTSQPAAHAEEEAGTGIWRLVAPEWAQRDKPGGGTEDDKFVDEHGGQVQFNLSNMETKCTARRYDRDPPKSAWGKANFLQVYAWDPQGNGPATPPNEFEIGQTKGGETKATPIVDSTITDPTLQAGGASAESSGTLTATNDTVNNSHYDDALVSRRIITYETLARTVVPAATEAKAKAGSKPKPGAATPGGEGGPSSPPAAPTEYISKACFAEGRAYWKFTAGRPYTVPNP